jgi:Glycosyltransferase WbsX
MNGRRSKLRVLAFYLPQFHPIPENNYWWGNGFTEWTNVGKAKKYFRNHYQPRVPEELGYYDLRVEETRLHQAELAKLHGIEGFCYWHYWFGNGKRLLERPLKEVLESKQPDFPFCCAWANESWKGFPHGLSDERNVLIEQTYPGEKDYEEHFYELLPYFLDKRYVKINGKVVFFIYKPFQIPDISSFFKQWKVLASNNGINDIAFIANCNDVDEYDSLVKLGFDYVNINRLFDYRKSLNFSQKVVIKCKNLFLGLPNVFSYKKAIPYFTGKEDKYDNVFPTIIPGWDHTPRSGKNGFVYDNSTPELFKTHIYEVFDKLKEKREGENIVFLKSWNEWAEGNYVEPDLKWGRAYLRVIKEAIDFFNK